MGIIYAIPNLYLDEPAVQISSAEGSVPASLVDKLRAKLAESSITVNSVQFEQEDVYLRFANTDTQLQAIDVIKSMVGNDSKYRIALTLMPTTPKWLQAIGAYPMKLGLDLRGGVHFLLELDIEAIIQRKLSSLTRTIKNELRNANIRYSRVSQQANGSAVIWFKEQKLRDKAANTLGKIITGASFSRDVQDAYHVLEIKYEASAINQIKQQTIEQTMSTLRNRVNELGVAESIVQQQGDTRIAVDLPGIQDATRAKSILGGTATLAFHLLDNENDPFAAKKNQIIPNGSKLLEFMGRPYLIKNEVILSGDSISSASASLDEFGQPAVNISLGGGGEIVFNRVTRNNVGNAMPIVFIETKTTSKVVNGETIKVRKRLEKLISVATIQGPLGSNFRITGLSSASEAKDLSLLLRAGALPVAIDIVEETTVGPTLGLENIKRGIVSLLVGMAIVIVLMVMYYSIFGLIANFAMVLNLFLLTALLSWVGATLTLPGIAAIVLTLGMAIDANVLIYERIREELRRNSSIQSAIYFGYDRAFETIVDANLTTLIVAVVLLAIGSGPIQAFAITLMLGLVTSMFTGLACTRAIVNLIYGKRKLDSLPIGVG